MYLKTYLRIKDKTGFFIALTMSLITNTSIDSLLLKKRSRIIIHKSQ
jgi:hypothetical protein